MELWREYGAATREHVVLLKEQEAAAGIDMERFRALEPQIEYAAIQREAARVAVRFHLATEHNERPRTMTA